MMSFAGRARLAPLLYVKLVPNVISEPALAGFDNLISLEMY